MRRVEDSEYGSSVLALITSKIYMLHLVCNLTSFSYLRVIYMSYLRLKCLQVRQAWAAVMYHTGSGLCWQIEKRGLDPRARVERLLLN